MMMMMFFPIKMELCFAFLFVNYIIIANDRHRLGLARDSFSFSILCVKFTCKSHSVPLRLNQNKCHARLINKATKTKASSNEGTTTATANYMEILCVKGLRL